MPLSSIRRALRYSTASMALGRIRTARASPGVEVRAHPLPEGGRFLRKQQRRFLEEVDVFDFAPEAQRIHRAQTVEDGNAPHGKAFRAGSSVHGGELEHQIGPGVQRPLCALPFKERGRLGALREAPAHHHHNGVRPGCLQCRVQVIGVALVEGVVFGYDTHGTHMDHLLPFQLY